MVLVRKIRACAVGTNETLQEVGKRICLDVRIIRNLAGPFGEEVKKALAECRTCGYWEYRRHLRDGKCRNCSECQRERDYP